MRFVLICISLFPFLLSGSISLVFLPISGSYNWKTESDQDSAYYGWSVSGAGDINGDGYSDIIIGAFRYDNGETDEGAVFVYYGSSGGLSFSYDWMGESNKENAYYGYSVAGAGDVNGDGYNDIIVGAPHYSDDGYSQRGAVFVYYGSNTGLSISPDWSQYGVWDYANFGRSVSTAGDVNGDGYDDVIVGAPYFSGVENDEGRVFVYYGSITGLSSSVNWDMIIEMDGIEFGTSVACAGDVNGDGYDDIIIGAPYYDNGETYEGAAFVYYGSSSGLPDSYNWKGESNEDYAKYGYSVSSAGDVNGDGYNDVVIGAPDKSESFVYYGGVNGLSLNYEWRYVCDQGGSEYGNSVSFTDFNGDGYSDIIVGAPRYDVAYYDDGAVFIYYGSRAGLSIDYDLKIGGPSDPFYYTQFGSSVAGAGDINNDGYDDIIIGAPEYDNGERDEGAAFVYYGYSSENNSLDVELESNQEGACLGYSVSSAGDVNGDGYSDVIVGAPYYDNGETDEGAVFVYYGSDTGLSINYDWMGESNQDSAFYGYSVSSAGDVNGDGYSDIIVGVPYYDNGETDEGAVFVYYGSDTGLSINYDWMGEYNQEGSCYGYSVASAGDVNGDGYSDVIVGSPKYDFGQINEGKAFVYYGSSAGLSSSWDWTDESNQTGAWYGMRVAGGGDFNGDGYSDIAVSAPFYDNGGTDEGKVFIYYGGSSGLISYSYSYTMEGDQDSARFGYSVASAGDVNGDGYSDLIISAPYYDNGATDEGKVFVYYGSSVGFYTSTPDWYKEGNDQDGALYGYSVSSAGDVNGDGYNDIIIGVPYYDKEDINEGVAEVYYGSKNGLLSTYSWRGEGNRDSVYYGYNVACAGDVNGDGYSDILVGVPYYDNGEEDEGCIFLYMGYSSELTEDVDWVNTSGQTDARLGWSVSSAGDVNGDGYSDIIVGAYRYDNGYTDEGAAFIYYGGANGIDSLYDWMATGGKDGAYFGYSVASAGDVNGDGYSDVIVGAKYYTDASGDSCGAVFAYYGSPFGPPTSASWWDLGNVGDSYGACVSSAGDFNGDGYSDIIVSAPNSDDNLPDAGKVCIYYGSNTGLSSVPDLIKRGGYSGDEYGRCVACAGDVNGDGYSDVLIGAWLYDSPYNSYVDEGKVYCYYGSDTGWANTYDWSFTGDQDSTRLGYSVASAGDVNGDGYSDIIIGAYKYDRGNTDEGVAYLFYGGPTGLSISPDWVNDCDQDYGYYGMCVSSAGDINNDGYADIMVAAPYAENGWIGDDEGVIYIYYGREEGLPNLPDCILDSDQDSCRYGYSMAYAGDVNGDGYSDIVIGAYKYDSVYTDEGGVFVYYGNGKNGIDYRPQQLRADTTVPIIAPLYSMYDGRFMIGLRGYNFNGRDRVKLQWEVKPIGQAFDGTITGESSNWYDTDTGEVYIYQLIDGLTNGNVYKWRVRLKYDMVKGTKQRYSRWFYIDDNSPGEGDIRIGTNLWYDREKPDNNRLLLPKEGIIIQSVIKLEKIKEYLKDKEYKVYDIMGRKIEEIKSSGEYFIVDPENKNIIKKVMVIR